MFNGEHNHRAAEAKEEGLGKESKNREAMGFVNESLQSPTLSSVSVPPTGQESLVPSNREEKGISVSTGLAVLQGAALSLLGVSLCPRLSTAAGSETWKGKNGDASSFTCPSRTHRTNRRGGKRNGMRVGETRCHHGVLLRCWGGDMAQVRDGGL